MQKIVFTSSKPLIFGIEISLKISFIKLFALLNKSNLKTEKNSKREYKVFMYAFNEYIE